MNFSEIQKYVYEQTIPTELLVPAKGKTFCCIGDGCRSGSGEHGTGATLFANDTRLQCWSCKRTFTALDVIAARRCGIPAVGMKEKYSANDYAEIIRTCADYYGLPLDERKSASKFAGKKKPAPVQSTPIKADAQELAAKEPEKPEPLPPSIDEARANLQKIVDAGAGDLTWRGLRLKLMAELGWGFLPDYHFHNNPAFPLFPAVIVPNDAGSVYARTTLPPPKGFSKGDNFAPAAVPTVIKLPDDADFILIVNEGAINAASSWQAVQSVERADKPALGFVSTGSVAYSAGFREWLIKRYPNPDARPRIVISYDNDTKDDGSNPGQKAALELVESLLDDGFKAANIILGGADGDVNDIVQREGNAALGNMIIDAVNAVQPEFVRAAADIETRKKIIEWEQENGKIEPATLAKVKTDVAYLQGLSSDAITAEIASSAKTIRAVARCRYYDSFARTGNEFMARVAQAIAAAKAATGKSTSEKPADIAAQSLAMISLTTLNGKIETAISEIGKAHRKFVKEYDEQQQRRQAAELESKRAEIRANNEESTKRFTATTRSILGCPLDLRVPRGFEFTDDGSLVCGDEIICTTPTIITKNLVGDDGEYVELCYRAGGVWKRRIVEKLTIADHKRIIELAACGITLTSATSKALSEFLIRLLDFEGNAERIPAQRLYDKPGWTDDGEFVYPCSDVAIVSTGIDYGRAFTTSGEKSKWLEMYRRVASSSTAARMVMGAALAAPLIKILGISNEWLHLAGDSGKGKSAAAKFAASIFGNPSKLTTKFNSTGNALEGSAMAFNDFPSFVEELQSASKKNREAADELIYNYETGSVRGRCAKNGLIRPIKTFRGVRISSGEQTLTNEFSGSGAIKRVLELQCDEIFSDEFAVEVHRFVDENYGLVGRDWIEVVKGKKESIKQRYLEYEKSFRKFAPTSYPNHLAFLAAITTAGAYFDKYILGVSSGDESPFHANGDKDVKTILASLPKKDSSANAARAINEVANFIASHPYHFKRLGNDDEIIKPDDGDPRVSENYGYWRAGTYAVFPTKLREILADFPDARAIIRGFAQAGYLIDGGNAKRPYQKSVRVEGRPQWMYVFRYESLFPDDDDGIGGVPEGDAPF